MGAYIETITQIKPKNDSNFAVADVNDLKGGYIQVTTNEEMQLYITKYSNRLKVGMLCYVKDENLIYQYRDQQWKKWIVRSGGSGGSGIAIIDDIEDLPDYETEGQLVFLTPTQQLYYYTNNGWIPLSRIYIQGQEPSDLGGLWVDTSDKGLEESSTTVKSLIQMINILSIKVNKLEYMNQQIQSGKFDNNMYNIYDDIIGIDPSEEITGIVDENSQSQKWDDDNQVLLKNTLLSDSSEPEEYKDLLPNTKHIQIKWGKYDDMQKYQDNFLPAELLWCYDRHQLWIKDPFTYKLIQIGTATSGGGVDIIDDTMNGIIQDSTSTYIEGITFVDMANSNKHYTFSVQNGELDLHDLDLDIYPNAITSSSSSTVEGFEYMKNTEPYIPTSKVYHVQGDSPQPCSMLGINAVYGASYNEYNLCDFNFVELGNQTPEDINLHGMYLHYTEDGTHWMSLKLEGVIKGYSSFLIRGARCANSTYSAVHIKSADYYWTKDRTLGTSVLTNVANTFDEDNLIIFANNCSLFLSGPLTTVVGDNNDSITPTLTLIKNGFTLSNPWLSTGLVCGFMDLVGFGTSDATGSAMPNISSPCAALNSKKLYYKYFNLDPVSQAYKAIKSVDGSNAKLWAYINLESPNQEIDLSKWNLEKGGHSLYFDKHKINPGIPSVVTCTFGYNPHTTRCFTWVSNGYRDEFIQYRLKGSSEWTTVESFKSGDGRAATNNRNNSIYDRIRSVSADGTYFTVHKVILDFPEPIEGATHVYEYQVGYNRNYTDIRTFTLRNRKDCQNFSFVQVTDQQGFNAEEYNSWRIASDFINKEESVDFVINTGDATQNGNRMGEWIDYFNAGSSLFSHLEQMYSVGNNDLCPIVAQEFGNGQDTTKCNPINVEYFFTFEHPFEIPKAQSGKYIPCCYSFVYGNTYFLCMNSELTDSTNQAAEQIWGVDTYTLYNNILKPWAEADLTHLTETPDWKIAYCHENPFTLLIKSVMTTYTQAVAANGSNEGFTYGTRGEVTSHFNSPGGYWFSKFLEDNGFNLSLCGHKHTYSESYYLHDNPVDRMNPYIYDEGQTLDTDAGAIGTLSTDTSINYVKYVMCQATGYKLVSNKELPADHITWLKNYYPADSNKSDSRVSAQKYPTYIVWNIGKGNETNSGLIHSIRNRILGTVKKLVLKSNKKAAVYKYNSTVFEVKNVEAVGGNGSSNPDHYVIVEKLK